MDHTIYDLDRMQAQAQAPSGRSEKSRWSRAAIGTACAIGALIWMWRLVDLPAQREPALVQHELVLSTPEPLAVQVAAPPAVVVTSPPVVPQVLQLPPPRPSLWEIRAELKRGLGEWEFPHYVNAPHYGSGPDSPAPSQLRPRFAAAPAE